MWLRLRGVLRSVADPQHEAKFVDDGSSDRSLEMLCELAEAHQCVAVLELSRNFRLQSAPIADGHNPHSPQVVAL